MALVNLEPTADNQRSYRNALGQFATGVAVVTAAHQGAPVGITVNSFASVSLAPPLVLWSLDKGSSKFDVFSTQKDYAIHVLAADQTALSNHFSANGRDFSMIDWQADDRGVPLIGGVLARFDCHLAAIHDAGDHLILVGGVQQFALADSPPKPLLFQGGAYQELK